MREGAAAGAGVGQPGLSWETVAKSLECTVCFDSMAGPIYQCTEGHLLCGQCWGRLHRPNAGCPTCSGMLGNIRCRFAESMRDALLGSEGASPKAKDKQLPSVPRHQAVKKAAESIGVGMEDLRGVMAREGVGLMEAVILAARTRVRGEIEGSGGVDSYERKKLARAANSCTTNSAHVSPQSPRNPPAKRRPPHAADNSSTTALAHASEPISQASTIPRESQPRPVRGEPTENGRIGDAASKGLGHSLAGKHSSKAASCKSPTKKKPEDTKGSAEDKYARYKEEIRKKADAIFNEPDPVPGHGAKEEQAAPCTRKKDVQPSDSSSSRPSGQQQQLAYASPRAKNRVPRAEPVVPAQESTNSPKKTAAAVQAKAPTATRPALNADVMAAYSSFRKEMKSKVLSTMRASQESTSAEHDDAGAVAPPHGVPPTREEQEQVRAQSSDGGCGVAGPVASECLFADKAHRRALSPSSHPCVSPPPNDDGSKLLDPPEGISSPASSEDDSKARSEAETRSSSATLEPSSYQCAQATLSSLDTKQPTATTSSAPASRPSSRLAQEGGGPAEHAAGGAPSKHMGDDGGGGGAGGGAPAAGTGAGDDTSSLHKLRFPKIRTDLATQASVSDGGCALPLPGPPHAERRLQHELEHAVTQIAREVGWGCAGTPIYTCPVPPSEAPPSSARSAGSGARRGGRGEKVGRPTGSASNSVANTPRDAVRAVKGGDRSGAGVWRIVAGVRNRLRRGPGR